MSLNREERLRTSRELHTNLVRSGLAEGVIADSLGFSAGRLRDTLNITGASDPADVWLLRDFLDRAIREAGGEPDPWSVLTDEARLSARQWFTLRKVPPLPPRR